MHILSYAPLKQQDLSSHGLWHLSIKVSFPENFSYCFDQIKLKLSKTYAHKVEQCKLFQAYNLLHIELCPFEDLYNIDSG